MRYYLYISDAKLDMLFAQIPVKTRERLAAELKFDIKVVSLSLRQNPTDETRYSKLEAVETYLAKEAPIGTVDKPEVWFAGALEMIVGPLGQPLPERPPVVYFSGETDQTIVGMGGSVRHLVGASIQSGTTYELPSSSIAALLKVLEEEAERTNQEAVAALSVASYDQVWPVFMATLLKHQTGVPENVEFLAKRLTYTPPHSPQVEKAALLGSPLYVALID